MKAARLELGLTQEELGRALGRTQPWVREVESGRTAAQPYVLAALAAATGRSVGWFFGEPDGRAPRPDA
ncbi:MAG: helix-turn-helix transcriptional regulator [Planctomycetes bacterium]|nr:helix-turn-helix transcriptional regulator [Planctomycetota bacterium]